ncbi:MAG TPA: hypothetical protein VMH33_09280, partial [Solirubrobacterales bacterium]|nr:hypothetical protein [Solirubrobacterales bacterium]
KIKKEAITGAKVKKGSLTGTQINSATLGNVPSATNATNASVASSLTPHEAIHLVGTAGNPPFENGSANVPEPVPGIRLPPAGFYKDKEGVVHLTGYAEVGTGTLPAVFTLPAGFRPASNNLLEWEPAHEDILLIAGTNVFSGGFDLSGKVIGAEKKAVLLEGITFQAGS